MLCLPDASVLTIITRESRTQLCTPPLLQGWADTCPSPYCCWCVTPPVTCCDMSSVHGQHGESYGHGYESLMPKHLIPVAYGGVWWLVCLLQMSFLTVQRMRTPIVSLSDISTHAAK